MGIKRRVFLKMLAGTTVTAASIKAFGLAGDSLKVVSDPYAYPPQYRGWEDLYRDEWTWDSVARSTHGVNCTGSCSWKVYVKDGMIMREEQAADFPVIDPALPDLNPRGCNKGACYTAEYVNGDRRIKYPLRRTGPRGSGQWERISWDTALTDIADQVIANIQDSGPDSLTFFSPIPAMSPVSFSAGIRLAHLLGGVACSFYDWYCDLPPGSPITLGEQTDVAESTDWVNSKYMILWGSNPVQTRIPDAHFVTEAKYNGCKVLAIYPDFASSSIRADRWLSVEPGTDAALALAICQHLIASGQYDVGYLQEQTDMPFLVDTVTGKYLREADVVTGGAEDRFYVWSGGQPELAPDSGLDLGNLSPVLNGGSYDVDTLSGSVTVETVFDRLATRLQANDPYGLVSAETGVSGQVISEIADEIGAAGISSGGQVMIMHGAGTNHWYHNDLNNRAMLLMLSLLGAIGKNGGGFNHYVGQEKIWPGAGLGKLSFPLGTAFQRFQNTTLWTHVHAELDDQPAADMSQTTRGYMFDSVANGWMPLYPEGAMGNDKASFVANGVPVKDPKMMFIWRANWFNQAKGNNYIEASLYPKLNMIVDLNFQMDTTAFYADIVLPSASHYEKHDLNTTDMHSFCHPFNPAIPPMFESKTDWQIFQALAAKIEERAGGLTYDDSKAPGGERDLSTLASDFTNNGAIAADIDAAQLILDNAPETVGMTMAGITAQPQRFNATTNWTSNIEEGRPYTAFLKHTEGDKDLYHTLTGRQQYLIEHEWFVEAGEELPTYKPPVLAAGEESFPLLYNTPHGRWAIHSTWRNAKQMLRLNRGGPICYMHPSDMASRGLVDDDWVKMHNNHGQVIVRVKAMESEKAGRVTMFHSWERYVGVKGQMANFNSVTGIRIKPTQLAGGYGQLKFKLNYWGPTGVQRDTRVEVEKYVEP
ncbi:MAG: molybdopterin-dependent oxidoreductase [Pseudomonadota bacterium]